MQDGSCCAKWTSSWVCAAIWPSFWYWSHKRHVNAKAEHLGDQRNPRYVVTSVQEPNARVIYGTLYCPRGQAENAIKDFKRALAADRLSCTTDVANAFRLALHALAYRLRDALRRVVVRVAPGLGRRRLDTLRLILLRVGALVAQTSRRFTLQLPTAVPMAHIFVETAQALGAMPLLAP
jgi:hypothetical protein